MITNRDNLEAENISDFPVIKVYKYLGVRITPKMSANKYITFQKEKVDVYLKRNFILHKKYFSPFTLIRIVDYFVKSRLSYRLSCFMDSPATIKKIYLTLSRHLKKIFGLTTNNNGARPNASSNRRTRHGNKTGSKTPEKLSKTFPSLRNISYNIPRTTSQALLTIRHRSDSGKIQISRRKLLGNQTRYVY